MFRYARALASLVLLAAPVSASEASWTQFRGHDRNGISPETGLLHAFPEAGPEELWRRPLGAAFSGIVASGDALYTTESDDEGDYAVKLDAASGKTLWRRKIGPRYTESFGNGPRATPALDGERLYVLSGDGHVAALSADDGEILWTRSLMDDYRLELPTWGFASAPLVVGDHLILSVGANEGRAVVAFDKASGEVRWSAGEGEAAYGSPVVIQAAGRRQLVVLDFTLLRKAPHSYRLESTFFGQPSRSISDGESAWQTDPQGGQLAVLPEEALALALEERFDLLGPFVLSIAESSRPELVGDADVDGMETYHVRVHLESGRTQDYFLAKDTFLVRKTAFSAFMSWMGAYTAETFFMDYQKHDGLAWPDLMERQDGTFTSTFLIDSVEIDPELPDSLFQGPKDSDSEGE